ELAALCRWAWPQRPVNDPSFAGREPVVLVNGRWLAPEALSGLDEPHVGLVGGQISYGVLPPGGAAGLSPRTRPRPPAERPQPLPGRLPEFRKSLPARTVGGALIDWPWDLVEHNAAALIRDEALWRTHREAASLRGLTIQGPADRFLADASARVEPFVLIDTT